MLPQLRDRRSPASSRSSQSSSPSETTPRRPSAGFLALVGLVIVAAVIVRLATLGRQSYWVDELFSVNESSGSVQHLLKFGSTEVHTPLYAALLWIWMKIGSTHETWTRLLSTLYAVGAVLVTHRGLRGVRLDEQVRWALTAATAASGTSIVYSLETRSYALLLLGSVGLTVTTLRVALLTLNGEAVPRRSLVAWTGWSALAATAHLFGAILTLAALTVLVAVTLLGPTGAKGRRILAWLALAAAGCSLQVAWLLRGLRQPGFASGTDWIQAPRGGDVRDLITTTFSSGAISAHKDGFAWTSPIGAIAAFALGLAAALYGYRARSRVAAATAPTQAATVLLALATVVIVATFGLSQWKHLWTLRNLVIVTPALLWGVICLAAAAARTAAGARIVATAAVVLLGASLVPTAIGVAHPYKTDFRGLSDYLIGVQAQQPDASYLFIGGLPPGGWRSASDRPADDPAWNSLYQYLAQHTVKSRNAVVRTSGTQVVIYYHNVTDTDPDISRILTRLGPSRCRQIPIYGLGVLRCEPPHR